MKVKSIKNENYQFMILYFIGIFLVVGGHGGGGGVPLFAEWFPAYSFHMALFIFCSGYFFVNKKDEKVSLLIKRIFTRFIIPFFLWNLFYGIISTVLCNFGYTIGGQLSFRSLFITSIYNGHQFAFNCPSWFIWPLAIVQFINIFTIKLLKKNDNSYILYFILCLLIGFAGVTLAIKGYNSDWLLLVDKVMYFLPFFALGMLYRVKLEKIDKLNNLCYFGIIFLIAFIQLCIRGYHTGYNIAWFDNFDNFYRPFIVGIIGIAFWLRISRILVPSLKDSKTVKFISKNTFSIMMHHLMGFFIMNTIYYTLHESFGWFAKFDVSSYKSSIYYLYLPNNNGQFTILYGISGFLFSILMIKIVAYCKKIMSRIISK